MDHGSHLVELGQPVDGADHHDQAARRHPRTREPVAQDDESEQGDNRGHDPEGG